MVRHVVLLLSASFVTLHPAIAYQPEAGRRVIRIDWGRKPTTASPESVARRAEAERRAAEARALSAAREADYAKRRQALIAANQLSAQRQAESERLARMRYDAQIARDRAAGCRVPGDPPGSKKPACVTPF